MYFSDRDSRWDDEVPQSDRTETINIQVRNNFKIK